MVEETIVKIVRKFIYALKRTGIQVDKVILYGSYKDGRQRKDSDIDVAIISREFGIDPVEEGMNLFRIAGKVDSRIEPVPISIDSYQNDTWIPLIYEIRENGMELEYLEADELVIQ
jgi:predicted nucleotidyltransferase